MLGWLGNSRAHHKDVEMADHLGNRGPMLAATRRLKFRHAPL